MLELLDIHKTYENEPLLNGITFSVAEGETVCLLGASGSGKSTLLHIIAGLEAPDSGRVLWGGADLSPVPAAERNFGLVFQDYALFPHMDVSANVAFGLKMRSLGAEETEGRVAEALQMVGLQEFTHRGVNDLSGGEQQRVALARALVLRPRLLMFDEPLGALDRTLRDRLLGEMREILHSTHIPALYVTHDQEEAFAVADRVILLKDGGILQQGTPEEVYTRPASAWVAEFLGLGNLIEGRVLDGKHVETSIGILTSLDPLALPVGRAVTLLVRPERVQMDADRKALKGCVKDVLFKRDGYLVTLENGFTFCAPTAPGIGDEVSFTVQAENLG
jgi:spermidine/putrescine transport system ATP-binding protein